MCERRDLTAEGVEPNPGPRSATAHKTAIASCRGLDIGRKCGDVDPSERHEESSGEKEEDAPDQTIEIMSVNVTSFVKKAPMLEGARQQVILMQEMATTASMLKTNGPTNGKEDLLGWQLPKPITHSTNMVGI